MAQLPMQLGAPLHILQEKKTQTSGKVMYLQLLTRCQELQCLRGTKEDSTGQEEDLNSLGKKLLAKWQHLEHQHNSTVVHK